MQIRNINKVIHQNGKTSDIIDVVMYAYEIENDPQISVLADKLKADTVFETCKNIWQYLLDNIKYRADADGRNGEMIRTPARLIHDGTGDCKSYSLFTAVILRYLGIPHFFRFVSYNKIKRATHVYIVANNNIVIDAVAAVQLGYSFNQEVKYTYRVDMSERGTKISYLAGLPASRHAVGVSDDSGSTNRYAVWTAGESQEEITPGKAWLYAKYDLLNELINIATSKKEIASLYNELSIISALIWAYNSVHGNTDEFARLARVIVSMIANGNFYSSETDVDKRNAWFENIIAQIQTIKNPVHYDLSWWQLINTEVIQQNDIPELDGVGNVSGWTPIADALKKAGIYFLYLFIPESELKNYPAAVTKKRTVQNNLYKFIHKVDVFHSADTVKSFFRSGIIARTDMTPENYIKAVVKENDKNKLGSITLATVATILGIIISLIQIISMIWPNSEAANYDYKNGVPDAANELYDINKKTANSGTTGSGSSVTKSSSLWLGLGLLGTLLLTRKKEKI
jgi:hypothetical protein